MESIEELQLSNQKLREMNTLKDKLIAVIAHDVRNQLQSIAILLQMLLGEKDSITQEEFNELVNNVSASSKKATVLLNDLMFWSEYQSIENPEEFYDEINLWRFTEECLRIFREEGNNEFEFVNNVDNNVYINTDVKMLNLVFRLLIEAHKKMYKGKGKIEINSPFPSGQIEISIKNINAEGTMDEVSELSDVSSRFAKYGIKGEKGTGIGLILCHYMLGKNDAKLLLKGNAAKIFEFIVSLPANMLIVT